MTDCTMNPSLAHFLERRKVGRNVLTVEDAKVKTAVTLIGTYTTVRAQQGEDIR